MSRLRPFLVYLYFLFFLLLGLLLLFLLRGTQTFAQSEKAGWWDGLFLFFFYVCLLRMCRKTGHCPPFSALFLLSAAAHPLYGSGTALRLLSPVWRVERENFLIVRFSLRS